MSETRDVDAANPGTAAVLYWQRRALKAEAELERKDAALREARTEHAAWLVEVRKDGTWRPWSAENTEKRANTIANELSAAYDDYEAVRVVPLVRALATGGDDG